mmetsp:Transcript_17585/g.48257  ORF Transcript_17585/g.48257 Transcript_17585/m.48257 type:complete len:526 (-) Transcript_17585:118-1695(-)
MLILERIDRNRLHTDRNYLIGVAAAQLQKVDKYHRGLITAANFATALQDLGLHYGSKEVQDILEFCTVTDDGFVYYKELQQLVAPGTPRAKKSSIYDTIFPGDQGQVSNGRPPVPEPRNHVPNGYLTERTEDIRRLYMKWDRSFLNNAQFKAEIEGLGLPITEELDRLLTMKGPARDMKFGDLMYTLQVEQNDGRRGRSGAENLFRPCGGNGTASSAASVCSLDDGAGLRNDPRYSGELQSERSSASNYRGSSTDMRQAICDFVDGHIPSVTFRQHLRRNGITADSHLDKLIRTHECDNSVGFKDFARVLQRQSGALDNRSSQNRVDFGRRSAASSERGSEAKPIRPYASDDDRRSEMSWYSSQAPSQGRARGSSRPSTPTSAGRSGGYPPSVAPWEKEQAMRTDAKRYSAESRGSSTGNVICPAPPEVVEERPPRDSGERKSLRGGYNMRLEDEPPHGGKRLVAQRTTKPPFGRTCDVDLTPRHYVPRDVPFGTEKDRRHRRPEDAGTDEYRFSAPRSQRTDEY